jgi:hypothetical protein
VRPALLAASLLAASLLATALVAAVLRATHAVERRAEGEREELVLGQVLGVLLVDRGARLAIERVVATASSSTSLYVRSSGSGGSDGRSPG